MDTQNVSAQLYFKQLPAESASVNSVNYQDTFPNLSTNSVETDAQIENAFQDQLNLSEIYKSPSIFNEVKEKFMNETMEGTPDASVIKNKQPPPPPQVPVKIPVGPEDFLRMFIKEGFGEVSGLKIFTIIMMALVLVCLVVLSIN